jgi:hypothetical protein
VYETRFLTRAEITKVPYNELISYGFDVNQAPTVRFIAKFDITRFARSRVDCTEATVVPDVS